MTVASEAGLAERMAAAPINPAFVTVPRPVTREWLASQHVGPKFVHYLATEWPDFVARD